MRKDARELYASEVGAVDGELGDELGVKVDTS